ncbi:MAG: beta-ketoacyl-[acyl-carrier-protein] synthase family protein [Gammaproteobacteria bacterium]|nr:beta-ketoacyl-[acyl-carrier-protein] synthase family protein [Gammaproteobacteria bacterium]
MSTVRPRRVVVTGMGVVSSIGNDIESFWHACMTGQSRVESTPAHWKLFYEATSKVWSPLTLPDFNAYGLRRADVLVQDPVSLIAIVAAEQALNASGVDREETDAKASSFKVSSVDPDRFGVYVGTGMGGARAPFDNYAVHILHELEPEIQGMLERDAGQLPHELAAYLKLHPRVNPLVICQTMPNASSALLAIRYGLHGPNDTCCFACASGTIAIGRAYAAVAAGEADMALAGGTEFLGDYAGSVFMGFDRLQTLAKPHKEIGSENRPFDKDRSGFLFSEGGAGMVVVESLDHAIRRGAKPLAEICSFATSMDATSLVAISADATRIGFMLDALLNKAPASRDEIDYVNAHGTGTRVNDEVEAGIIAAKFGSNVIVNSTKSLLGHTIGASGAIEFIATALSVKEGAVHPSLNVDSPIPGPCIAQKPTHLPIRAAISESFGFGGHNAALLLRPV